MRCRRSGAGRNPEAAGLDTGVEYYRDGVIVRPVDEFGFVTIRIEGELVRLVHATHEIVDILSP